MSQLTAKDQQQTASARRSADLDLELSDDRSPTASNAARRFLRDTLRESDVVVILIGQTTFALSPELSIVQVHTPRDLLRVSTSLLERKICVVQVDAESYMLAEQLALLVHARIYLLVDVPDLEQSPQEKMLVSSLAHRVTLSDVEDFVKSPAQPRLSQSDLDPNLEDSIYADA